MLGPMARLTNLTKSSGQRKPTLLLLIILTRLKTDKEPTQESTQLSPKRKTNGPSSSQFSPRLQLTKLETMHGLMLKLMTPMRKNGKLTSHQLVPIILIQLKIHLLKLQTRIH
jgi:hypothetical protein